LWNGRKKNNKADKWEGKRFFIVGRGFEKRKVGFFS
jgi:hypothetical protein